MKNKWTEILIHCVVWLSLIAVPLLTQLEEDNIKIRFLCHTWLMLFGLMMTFYFNYLWCIDKLLYRRKWWLFIIANLGFFIALYFFDGYASCWIDNMLGRPRHYNPSRAVKSMFLYNDVIYYILSTGVALGVRYAKHLQQSEMERKKLEAEKLESEITLLKYQMQPHFFFNTLNNIYALISRSPAEAQNAVHRLSKLMRYILYENTSATIDLSKEVTFMENYAKLMQLRLSGEIEIVLDFPDDTDYIKVPPLLFIPLLENAFKHGTLPCEGKRFIHCSMQIDDERLTFGVENSLSDEEANEDRSHSGIGLTNLSKRLAILYGQNFSFVAAPNSERTAFEARLMIPLNYNTLSTDN